MPLSLPEISTVAYAMRVLTLDLLHACPIGEREWPPRTSFLRRVFDLGRRQYWRCRPDCGTTDAAETRALDLQLSWQMFLLALSHGGALEGGWHGGPAGRSRSPGSEIEEREFSSTPLPARDPGNLHLQSCLHQNQSSRPTFCELARNYPQILVPQECPLLRLRHSCRDKNVIVPRSEAVSVDHNASEGLSGKRLKNQVKWRIFITGQNTHGDLQNRRAAGIPVTGGFDSHSLPPKQGRTGLAVRRARVVSTVNYNTSIEP